MLCAKHLKQCPIVEDASGFPALLPLSGEGDPGTLRAPGRGSVLPGPCNLRHETKLCFLLQGLPLFSC